MSDELPEARVATDAVYIDGTKLPGLILKDGVYVNRQDDLNIVTVRFICGDVAIDDPGLIRPPCMCRQGWIPRVVHRADGPCYVEEQQEDT